MKFLTIFSINFDYVCQKFIEKSTNLYDFYDIVTIFDEHLTIFVEFYDKSTKIYDLYENLTLFQRSKSKHKSKPKPKPK